jgi:prepilin-type N-terminal cleavage/methylation domain-containing protein/prepilin-type processing-associated H-X9-DG protein
MSKARRSRAFTLIELLVVVAIIALLISILLPSLSRAREQARIAVCLSNERSLGQGLATYAAEFHDWLPGPNTSGMDLTLNPTSYTYRRFPTEPTQNMDWISPSMGRILGLPANENDRLVAILNNKLRCPSNKERYTGEYTGSGSSGPELTVNYQDLIYNSYTAVAGFHVRIGYDPDDKPIPPVFDDHEVEAPPRVRGVIRASRAPRFKIDGVLDPAGKGYVIEGARYVRQDSGAVQVTFNRFAKQIEGGNFMTWGPALKIGGDPFTRDENDPRKLTPIARKYAFRHLGRLNTLFFDGHGETMSSIEASRVRYWFPSGYIVFSASATWDPDDQNGDIIP